jgi:hypothetical protein
MKPKMLLHIKTRLPYDEGEMQDFVLSSRGTLHVAI